MTRPTDLLVVLAAAALTALIAVPLLHPALSHAGGSVERLPNRVQNPVNFKGSPEAAPLNGITPLAADGLEFTLKLDKEQYQPGETPKLTLVALNKGDKKCKTKATVRMTSTESSSRFSRSMPMPMTVYEKEVEVEVLAGQILVLPLETEHAVTANVLFQLVVSVGELHQSAGAFAVAEPETKAEKTEAVASK